MYVPAVIMLVVELGLTVPVDVYSTMLAFSDVSTKKSSVVSLTFASTIQIIHVEHTCHTSYG